MDAFKCRDCDRLFTSSQAHNSHRRHCKLKAKGTSAWAQSSSSAKANFRKSQLDRAAKIKIPRTICIYCGIREVSEGGGKYCSGSCSARANNTGRIKSPESIAKISASLRGRNSGGREIRKCLICNKEFTAWRSSKKKYCTRFCSSKSPLRTNLGRLSIGSKKGKTGGYREGSGRSFKGRYKGLYCGSTYELIFVIHALSNGLQIERCPAILTYEFKGETRKYFPDFLINGITYEVKGFHNAQSLEKARQHPHVVIVGKDEIVKMQSSIPEIQGKDCYELALMYDDPLKPNATCEFCGIAFLTKDHSRFCGVKCANSRPRSKRK